jgi:hypothetical protein
MKYKADLVFKGVEFHALVPVTVLGEADGQKEPVNLNVQIPGDITAHLECEYNWFETLLFIRMIKKIIG